LSIRKGKSNAYKSRLNTIGRIWFCSTLTELVSTDSLKNSVRFVLIEADSTWFRDPLELFINATMIDDADIVVPSKGYTQKGDDLAFSPILVEPTNTSIAVFDEINRRLLGNDSLYDQDVLNELCSVQYHGVVCRRFEYSEIADGKWFHLNDRVKNNMRPFIVNNNFYVGLKNKETRQVYLYPNQHLLLSYR
uniref:Nucleotid_trans domain-containing protein n=1 Tax=Angiostrongylus costaricensis TaxID=334426 RepID=A0A0R3PY52_ANGCS